MRDILDVHSHTLVSGHAYNTIREMTAAAAKAGLEVLGITEHAPAMPGSCHLMYFSNLKVLDRHGFDVEVLFGAELNIMDKDGGVDIPQDELKNLDITIASLHPPCLKPMSLEDNTSAVIGAIENPYINIIGHPDDMRYPLDFDAVVRAAKKHHTLMELNNSSLLPTSFRKNAREANIQVLRLCMKYEAPIVVNSDAHADFFVGRHEEAFGLLRELGFPEELVVNRSYEELKGFVNRFREDCTAS